MDLKSAHIFLVCGLLVFNCLLGFGSDAQPLPEQEVRALQAISAALKNLNWNVHKNSCINGNGFSNEVMDGTDVIREVNCSCSTVSCSVTSILLKRVKLVGVLPKAFADLTELQKLDLTGNFISGSIPMEFASLPLVSLSLLGNSLTGEIPPGIGDIASLEELLDFGRLMAKEDYICIYLIYGVLESNQLRGNLPESLGKLGRLRRLLLSANNFTGPIPETYGNLRNLTEFGIDGNDVSGKFPEFIGNWNKLENLHIQGTSMENPIPRAISELKNLKQLWITDLKGPPIRFPNVTNQSTKLEQLILRNCLIEGEIPEYIGQFNALSILDLSFNRLSGPIPETFKDLRTQFLFLTNNSLSGQVPSWILNSSRDIDLSYNNFTGPSPVSSCPRSNNVNLVSTTMNDT